MSVYNKRAFITGAYGQDGSYLAEYLLGLGYTVLGLVHEPDSKNINKVYLEGKENFSVCVGDMGHIETFLPQLKEFSPNEVYNIAAVSDLKTAKENSQYTIAINFTAFENLVAHVVKINPEVRIFQALSSRILDAHMNGIIDEGSSLSVPKNAYDEAKLDSLEKIVRPYREK